MIPTRMKKMTVHHRDLVLFSMQYILVISCNISSIFDSLYTIFICLKLICCQANKMGNKEGVVTKQFANMYDHFTAHAWQSRPNKHNRHHSAVQYRLWSFQQQCKCIFFIKVTQINYISRNQLHHTANLNFGLTCKKVKHCWMLSSNFLVQFS